MEVPPKEKKFKGYFYIARHYKWALDHMFNNAHHQTVLIVEGELFNQGHARDLYWNKLQDTGINRETLFNSEIKQQKGANFDELFEVSIASRILK